MPHTASAAKRLRKSEKRRRRNKGYIHPNKAARLKSRLVKRMRTAKAATK